MFPLILLSVKVDVVTQKKSYKKNMIGALGFNGSKIIFTLLTKVIKFHIRPTTIYIRQFSLQ